MNIEDMTVEQIEQYLKERKAPRKGELGGVMKKAIDVEYGETVWIKAVKSDSGAAFQSGDAHFPLHFNSIVETNVPERQPARRRMTAAEAAYQLEVGQEVWVKGTISGIDKGHKLPIALLVSKDPYNEEWYWEDTEIEAEA